jgi:hypothetical protein
MMRTRRNARLVVQAAWWACLAFLPLGCCREAKENPVCRADLVQRINHGRGCNGDDCSYRHVVLVKHMDFECFDSLACQRLVMGYLDTITAFKNVYAVTFHNDGDWHYHPERHVRDSRGDLFWQRDILVTVGITTDKATGAYTIRSYVFFDNDDNWIYDGKEWKPAKCR